MSSFLSSQHLSSPFLLLSFSPPLLLPSPAPMTPRSPQSSATLQDKLLRVNNLLRSTPSPLPSLPSPFPLTFLPLSPHFMSFSSHFTFRFLYLPFSPYSPHLPKTAIRLSPNFPSLSFSLSLLIFSSPCLPYLPLRIFHTPLTPYLPPFSPDLL